MSPELPAAPPEAVYNAGMKLLSLRHRRDVVELMDAPDLDERAHRDALAGLERINRASSAPAAMLPPILGIARERRLKQMTLLDVACGGGDVPVRLAQLAERSGVKIMLTLCDRSRTALALAQEAARAADVQARCILAEAPFGLPEGDQPFDIVASSLFLHHLRGPDVVATLGAMKVRAGQLLVVSDLRRSMIGFEIAWWATRVLSRSPIVHFDGPASVQAAWTLRELQQLAEQAGLQDAELRNIWPWRMLLTWRRETNP